MLATLKVRDLVLIEDVELEFAAGLNVLTGETGAGKSILLDALGLAAGARAGARSSVRPGAQQGSAVAIFDLPADHGVRASLAENGIPSEDDLILRRAITADGRTRAFVNDESVGVGLLRDLGAVLVEIHGQSDDRGLFDPATHRRLLDAFGDHGALVETVGARFEELQSARERAAEIKQQIETAAADVEYLRHTVEELGSLSPEPGEEEKLAAERALLMNAGRIAEEVSAAVELLSGERGAEPSLAGAMKRLSRMKPEAREAVASAERVLEQAFASAEEARRELEGFLSRLEADPGELEKKEERLFALRAAARKHGVTVDDLARVLSEAQAKLDSISSGDASLAAAEADVAKASAAYLESARALSARRKTAARELDDAVAGELAPLKLGHAKFRVALEPVPETEAGANGLERVAFEVATVEGAPFGPLAKIA
ncbi:MAG TPA: AAA family ATPase, partial [Rhizomicrobium sp.]|nr:AAA family ATPase [Rhizomicrobium sp.]